MREKGPVGVRDHFNSVVAPELARTLGFTQSWEQKGSSRFAYFADADRLLVVGGKQERTDVDLALAYGLSYAKGRKLLLLLPQSYTAPTKHRAPWLRPEVRPQIFEHDGESVVETSLPTREGTIASLTDRLREGQTLNDELRAASTPAYFQTRNADVEELFEWATKHPDLDPAHRRSERSWHCLGQKVLSVKGARGGLHIRADIHTTIPNDSSPPIVVGAGQALTGTTLKEIKDSVEAGIRARGDGRYRRPDEHWLQAVIRRDPGLVGVEQPALRELPAWRPNAGGKPWGRGYIDLIGVDAYGDLRIVETKLSKNTDDLLVIQGLDYYIWARAYERVLRERLGAPDRSRLEIHYVLGASTDGKVHVSIHARKHAELIDVPYRFQTVFDWYQSPGVGRPRSILLPIGQLP